MTFLLETPMPALVVGAVLITLAAIVHTSLRTAWSLGVLSALIVLTASAVGVELLIDTPREQAEQAADGLLDDVEANNLAGVLARLSPTATAIQADANRLMPAFVFDKVNRLDSIEVTLDNPASPSRAEAKFRAFVSLRHRSTGTKGGDMTDVTLYFTRSGDRWLLEDYDVPKKGQKSLSDLQSSR